MGKTRYKWWGYVKAVLRAYPGYCKALEELKSPALTPRYGGVGGGGDRKITEALALRTLPPQDMREYEAVAAAVKSTAKMPDGAERLRLISMVFFSRSHTLQGAADACNVSYSTAKRWHNRFIELVARKMDML